MNCLIARMLRKTNLRCSRHATAALHGMTQIVVTSTTGNTNIRTNISQNCQERQKNAGINQHRCQAPKGHFAHQALNGQLIAVTVSQYTIIKASISLPIYVPTTASEKAGCKTLRPVQTWPPCAATDLPSLPFFSEPFEISLLYQI